MSFIAKKRQFGTAGAAGAASALYVEDVFSTYLYAGTGSTQTINNGLALANSYDVSALMHMEDLTNEAGDSATTGSVTFSATQAKFGSKSAYFGDSAEYLALNGGVHTGDLTVECWAWAENWSSNGNNVLFGPWTNSILLRIPSGTTAAFYVVDSGTKSASASVSLAAQTWHHFALTRDGSTWRLYINGTQVATTTSGNATINLASFVLGCETTAASASDSWYGYIDELRISPECHYPDGTSFTPSTSAFSATLVTEGYGGMNWTKCRSDAYGNSLVDTERGGSETLVANNTDASAGGDRLTFNSDGYNILSTAGVLWNNGSSTYASWTFRKAPSFFDVVTYTGNGAARTIAHNLGSVPGCIIVKATSVAGEDWVVYHRGLPLVIGTLNDYFIRLNATSAQATSSSIWNRTVPTSTVFSVGNHPSTNANGVNYVAYLFAHDAGGFGDGDLQNVISCGSYTGVTYPNNTEINVGFEPQWVLIKNSSTTSGWTIWDVMRGAAVIPDANVAQAKLLEPNTSAAETDQPGIYPTATGFVVKNGLTSISASGDTMIYIAIRRPMKTPTAGTEVFGLYRATSATSPSLVSSFPVDMLFTKNPASSGYTPFISSRLTSERRMNTGSTAAEATDSTFDFDYQNGALSVDVTNYLGWMFRRAPGFFDTVCYTGTGVAHTEAHNLGVAPEMIIVKNRGNGTQRWRVYVSALGNTKYLELNTTNPEDTWSGMWNNTSPTSSVFTVGDDDSVNQNTYNIVAYLFATLAGVSKVGSYTGTAADLNVDCGFSAGARFVLIKRTDSAGDWYVWDSARGIVAGNDPYLLLNSTAAEVTSTDYIDPIAAGFTVTSSAPAALNASGGTYIFLAIA